MTAWDKDEEDREGDSYREAAHGGCSFCGGDMDVFRPRRYGCWGKGRAKVRQGFDGESERLDLMGERPVRAGAARERLGLPASGRMVVVSGGGWG